MLPDTLMIQLQQNGTSVEQAKIMVSRLGLPDRWGTGIEIIARRWPFLTAEQLVQGAAALLPSTLIIGCPHAHCKKRVMQILPDLDLHRGDFHWVEYRGGPANTLGFDYLAGEIRKLEERRELPYRVIRAFSVENCGLGGYEETSMSPSANGARQLLLGTFEVLAKLSFPTHKIFVYDLTYPLYGPARLVKTM